MMNYYCVVQCTYTSLNPLCYTPTRSIYTPKERFNQCLITLQSIRKQDNNSYIILCEESKITKEEEDLFIKYCDKYINFDNDKDISSQRDSLYKGATELMVIEKIIDNIVIHEKNNIKFFIKVGGRYKLNDNYNIKNFVNDKINLFQPYKYLYNTVLYAIPSKLLTKFRDNATKTINIIKNAPIGIESTIFIDFENDGLINPLSYIGISGNVAVDGSFNTL